MKKTILLFLSLILVLGLVSGASGDVDFSPNNPYDDDDIKASVEGHDSTTFDFYWM